MVPVPRVLQNLIFANTFQKIAIEYQHVQIIFLKIGSSVTPSVMSIKICNP